MAVEFRVLGDIGAEADGRPLDLGHARQRLVLVALLVDANRTVPVEQLITRVWGQDPPLRAVNTLQTYLARLRRALTGTGVRIERRSGGYRIPLHDVRTVDLHRFGDLLAKARAAEHRDEAAALFERALELWRGEALSGLESSWAAIVREGLDRQRGAAELDYIDVQLERGLHAEVVAELAVRAGEHPLDERIAGRLMLALHRSGRQDEAFAHYQRIRVRLGEELGADPGAELRALHQQILTANATTPRPAAAPVELSHPVPRQLPPPSARFSGRGEELDVLTETLARGSGADGATPIVVLHGSGGMGKTALALRWAHRHTGEFPDGQLYADLRGFDPAESPTPADVAVCGFLHALGVTRTAMPADADAQAAMYRTLVAGKRMLVVLDNARDSVQVAPLLPGSGGCAVLVTSRDRLAGMVAARGARPLRVGILTSAEAREVLIAWLGEERLEAESEAADEILARCAGLPLALSILAGRATAHPELPLADLVAELRDVTTLMGALDDGEPGASLGAVMSWSYQALAPDHTRVFGLLGLAPGPDIGVRAAANLLNLPPASTAVVLRTLERVSLLEQPVPGRYRMHDLVRSYAVDRARGDLPDDVRTDALRRLGDFYVRTALSGNRILHPHAVLVDSGAPDADAHPHPSRPADETTALAWFDAEHACLLATQQLMAARDWHHPVWQLAWALTAFHYRRGFLHEDLAVWPAAVNAADRLGDPAVRITTHRRFGLACARGGRHDDALSHLGLALNLAEETADRPSQAITRHDLAQTWELRGDDRQALDHATAALRLFQTLDNPVWKAQALNGVGWYLTRLGEHDEARVHCEAALALYREHGHPAVADVLDSLGHIAHHTGRNDDALDCYYQALVLYREVGNTYLEADTLEHLGHAHLALGALAQAREVWCQALELYRAQHRIADADDIGKSLCRLKGRPSAGGSGNSLLAAGASTMPSPRGTHPDDGGRAGP